MEIGGVKEAELTEKLKETLLGDLAYVYGKDTITFINKLKEFEIL